jgi:hypothetical protein
MRRYSVRRKQAEGMQALSVLRCRSHQAACFAHPIRRNAYVSEMLHCEKQLNLNWRMVASSVGALNSERGFDLTNAALDFSAMPE